MRGYRDELMEIKDPQILNRCQEAVFHSESNEYVNKSLGKVCSGDKQ